MIRLSGLKGGNHTQTKLGMLPSQYAQRQASEKIDLSEHFSKQGLLESC